MTAAASRLLRGALCAALLATSATTALASPTTEPTPTGDPDGPPELPSIRADVNRDGIVDLLDVSDEPGKHVATAMHGALFLPNLDDDSNRCPEELAQRVTCHDAEDDIINGPEDLKDLAPIKTTAFAVPDATTATVEIRGAGGERVRLFAQRGDQYSVVTNTTTFTTAEVRAGLNLWLEGKDIVRDTDTWDGSIRVKYTVTMPGRVTTDGVTLRVAPMLSHAHTQRATQLLAAPGDGPEFAAFRTDITTANTAAGFPGDVRFLDGGNDPWAQDWMEPMYAALPTANGSHAMRLLMRSDQVRRAHTSLYELLGRDVGVVELKKTGTETAGDKTSTYTSLGNLETIPPHLGYPAGRQIVGGTLDGTEGPSAATMRTLRAQGAQHPMYLDTSWLTTGHVDEIVSFLPADTPLGWRIAVADPAGAVEVLKATADAGHGLVPLVSHPDAKDTTTIAEFLADEQAQKTQAFAAERIAANVERLLAETPATDADVVRVPVLFAAPTSAPRTDDSGTDPALDDTPQHPATVGAADATRHPRRSADGTTPTVTALLPGAVNLVVGPDAVIAPRQFGPQVDGVDVMQSAVETALSGYAVRWVDAYAPYHVSGGDVHCATNTLRAVPQAWWGAPGRRPTPTP